MLEIFAVLGAFCALRYVVIGFMAEWRACARDREFPVRLTSPGLRNPALRDINEWRVAPQEDK